MDAARQALQEQKVEIETAASATLHSEQVLQEEQLETAHSYLKNLHDQAELEQSSACMSEKHFEH